MATIYNSSHDPIFLIGYMGCGKTTLGRALAKRLGREFIDLDFYITQRFRKSVPEIFAERGEEGFRQLERSMLREIGEFSDIVIACGGGTPCHYDNMDYMNSHGLTIWLQAERARLIERLKLGAHKRPLISGKTEEEIADFLDENLAARSPWYSQARLTVDSTRLETKEEIADTVTALVRDQFSDRN